MQILGGILTNTLLTPILFVLFVLTLAALAPYFDKTRGGSFFGDSDLGTLILGFFLGVFGAITGLTSGIIVSVLGTGAIVSAIIGFAVYVSYFYLFINEKVISSGTDTGQFVIANFPATLSAFSCVLISIIFNSPTTI